MASREMEQMIKEALGTSKLRNAGISGGGCISSGDTYDTDQGRVFIKVNTKPGAKLMFNGEFASLEALHNVGIVRVPKPLMVLDKPGGGAMLIMEYVDMGRGLSKYAADLGEKLARLHQHNEEVRKKLAKGEKSIHKDGSEAKYIEKFGFHVNTCCGYLEMDNSWHSDWQTFYANKIEKQISLLEKETFYANKIEKQISLLEKEYGDREARHLWSALLPNLPKFFEGLDIKPALLHGDLWGGNVAENNDGPVIFDPASFYGHSEFDLGISYLFGGFNSNFFDAYFKVLPQQPGCRKRKDLYKLFHYLNHWNHFGSGYKSSSLSTLQSCLKHCK